MAAQEKALIDADAQLVNAPTCTGEDRYVVSFRPRPPSRLYPQDHKVPSVLMATQAYLPVETFAQLVNAPTCVGEDRLFILF